MAGALRSVAPRTRFGEPAHHHSSARCLSADPDGRAADSRVVLDQIALPRTEDWREKPGTAARQRSFQPGAG